MNTELHSFKRARAASRDEQAVWMRFIRMCKRNKTLRYIFTVILFLFIVFLVEAILWKEDLSKVGDAFNILNTFFTALAFIGLIVTILLQRKDLALQRDELKLQREEMKRQCEEQKRQANEFEAQNRLMKIQQFESFFFKQLEFQDYLSKNIRVNRITGTEASNKIVEIIRDSLMFIQSPVNFFMTLPYDIKEINERWCIFEKSYNDLIPWVDKFYFLIRYIKESNFLKDQDIYLDIVLESLSNKQKYLLQIMGQISSKKLQKEIEEELRESGYFSFDPKLIFGEEYEKNREIFKKSIGLGSSWYNDVSAIIIDRKEILTQ